MEINVEFIVYGLIFVAVLLMVEGIYLTVFGKSISLNNRVSRRIDMLEKGAGREEVLERLRKEMALHEKSGAIFIHAIFLVGQKSAKSKYRLFASTVINVDGRTIRLRLHRYDRWHQHIHPNSHNLICGDGSWFCIYVGQQKSKKTSGPIGRTAA